MLFCLVGELFSRRRADIVLERGTVRPRGLKGEYSVPSTECEWLMRRENYRKVEGDAETESQGKQSLEYVEG